MTATALPSPLDEFGWMLGEEIDSGTLDDAARARRETRIAAMLFKRRYRLLIRWRQQSLQRPVRVRPAMRHRTSNADAANVIGLPYRLPPLRGEIAIWRSYLVREIDHILFGND